MKTTKMMKSIAAFVILMFAVHVIYAAVHDPKEANELRITMKKYVPYPEFAKESYQTGFVVIAFNVDYQGKIVVKAINGSTPKFKEYVEEKLKDVVLENPQAYQDKTQYYRFDFQLVNDY